MKMRLKKRKSIPVSLKHEECEVDSYDLTEILPFYYDRLRITENDVKDVKPKFVDVPGYVYTEFGVAGSDHPTGGSIGVYTQLTDGSEAQMQVIYYYDWNPKGTHCNGKPHWNQEIRLIDRSGKAELIRGKDVKGIKHVVPSSPYLEICYLNSDGKPKTRRINRNGFKPKG